MAEVKPYYQRGNITIYHGDCLEIMPQLAGPFDAIIADLPYKKVQVKWDEIIPFEPLWESYKRLIKSCGAIVLFGCQPFTSHLVTSNLEWFKYEWAWKKSHATGQLNAYRQPMTEHENILIFGQGRITYNPQLTPKVAENIRPQSRLFGQSECYGAQRDYIRSIPLNMRVPTSVLEINSTNHGERGYHPTQKPVALLSYLIRTYTNSGEIVLDNTIGSGSTLVAAVKTGRPAVGIELLEEYCEVAAKRLDKILDQPSLFEIEKPVINRPEQHKLFDEV